MELALPPWLLISSLVVSILLAYLFDNVVAARSRRRPPGPARLPIFGNLFALDPNLHTALARLAKIHGPVMALKLGAMDAVVVSSPDAAREVLQQHDGVLSDRFTFDVNHVLGHADASVVFLPPNQVWKQLRSILASNMFSTKCIESNRSIRQQKMRELVAYYRAEAGRPVNFRQAAYATILNILSNIVFSVDMADLNSKSGFGELVSTFTEEVGKPNVSDFFPMLKSFDLQRRRRDMFPIVVKFYGILNEFVDARLSSEAAPASTKSSSGDFLDYLIQLLNEAKLDRKVITPLLADLFIAGTDTTAIGLTWAMAELLRNPAAMARARAEVEEVVGSRSEVEESDIPQLPYVNAVIKEALRLHAPAPLLVPHRVPEEGVVLGGYLLPKGAQVLVNAWAIGRDEKVWSEPELFRPERFLEKDIEFKGRGFELLSFGSGRRACPGMPMAQRAMHLTLATLLHAFEWRLPDGMKPGDLDMTEKFGLSLSMAVPLKVVASPLERTK